MESSRKTHVSSRDLRNRQRPSALDGTDLALLAELACDGRATNAHLAAKVGVAESTCAYRVKALRDSGTITAIRALVDPAKLGSPVQAIVKLRLGSHDKLGVYRLFESLQNTPGVLAIFHVAGEDDFHLHVAVPSPEKLRDLVLEHITMHAIVRQTETQLVFEVREGPGVLPRAH